MGPMGDPEIVDSCENKPELAKERGQKNKNLKTKKTKNKKLSKKELQKLELEEQNIFIDFGSCETGDNS